MEVKTGGNVKFEKKVFKTVTPFSKEIIEIIILSLTPFLSCDYF